MYYRRTEDGQLPLSRALGPHKRSLFSQELIKYYLDIITTNKLLSKSDSLSFKA
jgi:hypothetical protein